MDPVRVAILDCDKVASTLVAQYPTYGQMFIWRLQAAMKRLQRDDLLEFSSWDVTQNAYPDPFSIDSIVITGAAGSAYDPDDWIGVLTKYIADVYHNHPHVKIFGSCFGHQVIAHAVLRDHGVTVEINPRGRQLGIRTVDLTPTFRSHFPDHDLTSLRLQVIHGDHVRCPAGALPPGWTSIGASPCCDVHGLFLPQRVLTYQGHFEFDEHISRKCIEYLSGLGRGFTPELVAKSLEDVTGPDDAEVAADILLAFLTEGRFAGPPTPPQ